MTGIDQLICQFPNPFDGESLTPGNFWQEQQDTALTVNSIHQGAIAEIEEILDRVTADNRSRTILLLGEAGSGKSYLLGRIKRLFNPKAFFAYIGPWSSSDRIWRHTLRYTVESLTRVPDGENETQLMLWLKSLSVFRKPSVKEMFFEESVWNLLRNSRQKFISQFRTAYRNKGIYNAARFFGVLHDLTNTDLREIACDWLRGDDLSEEDLATLKVRNSIQTEEAACEILSNLGRIASATQPIVLCFDQLDGIPSLNNGLLDLQALLNINTNIHNQNLENFLVLISATVDTWNKNSKGVHFSDLDRIDKQVNLKKINRDQIEALWAMRLYALHQQAQPQPASPIYPLNKEQIKLTFPGGKALPRAALMVGKKFYQGYKKGLIGSNDNGDDEDRQKSLLSAFDEAWKKEYAKVQKKIVKITFSSEPELIEQLRESLIVLQAEIQPEKLLSGRYSNYSLSFQHPQKKCLFGVVWMEGENMKSFCNVMKACEQIVNRKQVEKLCLIRVNTLGTPNLVGNKLYRKIFTGSTHLHIRENLTSVHILETYYRLLNSAKGDELFIADKKIDRAELDALVRESQVLEKCQLLQDLGIFTDNPQPSLDSTLANSQKIQAFVLNYIKTHGYSMGLLTAIDSTLSHFGIGDRALVERQIEELIRLGELKIHNPKGTLQQQIVSWVPASQKKLKSS